MSARSFAEKELQVDEVLRLATDALGILRDAQTQRAELLHDLRANHEAQADREAELVAGSPERHPGASDTERNRRLKNEIQTDPDHRALRQKESDIKLGLDHADHNIVQAQRTVDVMSARMNELGGLLHYYAAALDAQPVVTTTTTSKQKTQESTSS